MKDKKTLYTQIVLLILFLPLSIVATVVHSKYKNGEVIDTNPSKSLIYQDKVYFYDGNNLLGTYPCKTCLRASSVIDDDKYHINYYKYGVSDIDSTLSQSFGIIKNSNSLELINVKTGTVVNRYEDVKTYKIDSKPNVLINKKDGKWGIVYLDLSSKVIANNYEFIGVPAFMENNNLSFNKFIVYDGSKWQIIDRAEEVLVQSDAEIVDFSDNYYVTYDGSYHVYDYNNNAYLTDMLISNAYGAGKYLFVRVGMNLLIYEKIEEGLIDRVMIVDGNNVNIIKNEKNYEVYVEGNLRDTIALG